MPLPIEARQRIDSRRRRPHVAGRAQFGAAVGRDRTDDFARPAFPAGSSAMANRRRPRLSGIPGLHDRSARSAGRPDSRRRAEPSERCKPLRRCVAQPHARAASCTVHPLSSTARAVCPGVHERSPLGRRALIHPGQHRRDGFRSASTQHRAGRVSAHAHRGDAARINPAGHDRRTARGERHTNRTILLGPVAVSCVG